MHVTISHTDLRDLLDVVVIGAGQAGLAVGHQLAAHGATFVILDAAPEVGSAWRNRWDSLRLFSPAQYDSLPGMPFPAPADTHPTKDDVADYLADYAAHFALPVRLNTPVQRLHRDHDRTYLVTTSTGVLRARQVVIATGPFQRPFIPAVAANLPPHVNQLHSADYRNPAQVTGRVLVVGGGNSGLQIAAELADTCSVTVAVGSRPVELPQRVAGRDLFFWLTKSGFFTLPSNSRLAQRLRSRGRPGHRHQDCHPPAQRHRLPAAPDGARCRMRRRSPTAPPSRSMLSCGRPGSAPTTPGCTSPESSSTERSGTKKGSPSRPACSLSACPGRPAEVPRFLASLAATQSTS